MDKRKEEVTSSDSDASLPDVECETCGIGFSSLKSYKAHMKGKKHQKKVAQEKFLSKQLMASKKEKGASKSDSDDDDENEMHCEVCDKYFSGHVSFMAHLKGSVHAKYVKKQKIKERMGDMPEVLDKENKGNGSEEDDDDCIFPKPFARCSTCHKEFSGPEPFASHMKSTIHKKKLEQSKKLDFVKAKHLEESNKSDDDDFFAKCDACQKSFSGPIPYHIHMKSSVHKKNLEKKKVAEEMKEFYSKEDPNSDGYVCKECKKVFTDPVNFKQHLANNSHEKQKAKTALKEFLKAFPEIKFVTSFEEINAEDENDSDDSDHDYYLICKICHASFSGPESAQDHVKSKKHISLKKQKQMLKLLKEQKKQQSNSASTNDKKGSQNSNDEVNNSILKNGDSKKGKAKLLDNLSDDFELI